MAKQQERVDFSWRYQPLKSTADGVLLSHVKYNFLIPPREMILQALRPYWLPLAYQEKGDTDGVVLERMFRNAVYALEKHALYLCEQGGIDYPRSPLREAPVQPSSLLLEAHPRRENAARTATVSSNLPGRVLTTDEMFELVGGDDFDDSGFS
jgi:hypothetical protein